MTRIEVTVAAGSITLESPLDWWTAHKFTLAVMGISDAGPVASAEEADRIGKAAKRRHDQLTEAGKKVRK